MYSGESTRALPRVGFPIRRSRDQRSVSTSPGLIAAAHVLHRLLAPRHPPCALVLLIRKNTRVAAMEFSRCAPTARWTVSQNSTAYVTSRSTLFQASRVSDGPKAIDELDACESKSSRIP